ncbi:MAG: translation initiation factor [Caldilineaceae bacterium]|nr:translation initiation factor [Caldilineaceae bacterium]
MSNNRRLAYSTDPEPEPEIVSVEIPHNPAAPFAVQGNQFVYVRLERKGRRGKTVSLVEGVLSPALGKQALLKHLKNALGTGGALKDGVLEIQGDNRDRIVELLTALGYKAKKAGG